MSQIYLDNASTSFPKPKAVVDTIYSYLTENGSNINRGCYTNAYSIEEKIFECRQRLCSLFNGPDPSNIIFTKNITESLNVLIKGLLHSGDHVLVSSMEHNAIMRPLTQISKCGITFSRIPCFEDGSLDFSALEGLLLENTKAIIMTHASNVCGSIMPIREVGSFCKEHGLFFIVDSAQTAGLINIDIKDMNIDALAFTGHKALMGSQGIGGFIISDELAQNLEPLIAGGSGSFSHLETIPDLLPDKFEAGTPNIPGILGLNEGLKWIEKTGIDNIFRHEINLTEKFLIDLCNLENLGYLRILGKHDINDRLGVISIQTQTKDLSKIAYELDEGYGIMTRVGLHCAPNAHKILKSFPIGSIRFSFGYFNKEAELDYTINALRNLLK